MIDCHNHLHDDRLGEERDEIVSELRNQGVTMWLVNGTSPGDWQSVADMGKAHREVLPFFGLHPWKTKGRQADWQQRLEKFLTQYPESGIGETGLDKWIRDADLPDQIEVFRRHLDLAAEWNRPVAVHCLQAWGTLAEVLKEYRGTIRFLLHSYSGPVEMLDTFAEMGAFFSLSGYFFRQGKEPKLELFREISRDRLLVETDAPDMPLPEEIRKFQLTHTTEGNDINHPANVVAVYESTANLLGVSTVDLVAKVRENASRWLGRQLS